MRELVSLNGTILVYNNFPGGFLKNEVVKAFDVCTTSRNCLMFYLADSTHLQSSLLLSVDN